MSNHEILLAALRDAYILIRDKTRLVADEPEIEDRLESLLEHIKMIGDAVKGL